LGAEGQWSTTIAWGRKNTEHGARLDAWILESAVKPDALWTFYARGERVDEAELVETLPPQSVSKVSFGAVRDVRVADHVLIGLGGQYAFNWPGPTLRPYYGGNPHGAMAFVRLKIQ
jgi:hypothetical protein